MGLYLKRSLEITLLFKEFVPLYAIHVYSIDEVWLKLNGTERIHGDKWQWDIEGKKKGLAEWTYEDVPQKLWPVKVEDCWGIGKRIARQLNKIGVTIVGGLAKLPLGYLE